MHTGPRGPLLFGWCTHYVPTTSHQPLAIFCTAPAPPHTLQAWLHCHIWTCPSIHVSHCLEDFQHKPALVAPIILWLEYFLCAHHTNFPNFQLLGTHADPHGPAFLPTWPFTACTPPCTPFCTPPHTSVHPCTTFCASLSRASHPYQTFQLTLDPFSYLGQLSPSATGHNAHPQTSVESSPNSAAPIWPIHFLCGPAQPT